MEVVLLSPVATPFSIAPKFSAEVHRPFNTSSSFTFTIKCTKISSKSKEIYNSPLNIGSYFITDRNLLNLSSFVSCNSSSIRISATTSSPSTLFSPSSVSSANLRHWMVVMDTPPKELNSKPEIINYYVKAVERVLGSEKDAQMCIYDASCDTHFGFCCDIDEESSRELASLPGVLSVRPDPDFNYMKKDYSYSKAELNPLSNSANGSSMLSRSSNFKHWLIRMDQPTVGLITKAQVVDYYVEVLMKVLGNEKDAQMCIYHISWQFNFGFCCDLDDDCARELAGVPGVLSVQPDENFESDDKDYGGESLQQSSTTADQATNIRTKKLFVTGLSFYTSDKSLRAAFEGFGELVEVRIIMDKISKRSRGYAFIEYTTEEAASAALKEMNGKIINGWMIVVDVAKTNPTKYNRGRPRPSI